MLNLHPDVVVIADNEALG